MTIGAVTIRASILAATALLLAGCGESRSSPTTTAGLAPIVIESPAPGAAVPTTFRVSGTASVFEATLVVEAVRDGKTLARRTVTASEGAPGRGSFATTLRLPPGPVTVHAYSPSAADGSRQHEVQVSVRVRP